jgi:predicted SAM-dependent methyltransferase
MMNYVDTLLSRLIMNKRFNSLMRRLLSQGEFSAWLCLRSEFLISLYHREGLRHIRRGLWLRPAKINLGSGSCRKEGFLNVDMFPGGDLTLDLRRKLPFESGCCEIIFSEHCIEHIDYPETATDLFRECLRILKPGGTLRLSVPDTAWPLADYAKGSEAEYFRVCALHSWHPGYCTTRLEHINYHFRQGGAHLFAYDEETAGKILQGVGFQDVRRVSFDPNMDSRHREIGSLFMSARKST